MKTGTYVQHRETRRIGIVRESDHLESHDLIESNGERHKVTDDWIPIPDLDAIDWADHAAFTTECLRTWRAPLAGTAKGLDYLRLGAIGELGEAASIVAKVLRDGTPVDDALRLKFANEVGDCCWFEAVEHEGFHLGVPPGLRPVVAFASTLGLCPDPYGDGWEGFLAYCRRLVIAKLRDRAVRGKIGGSGDER